MNKLLIAVAIAFLATPAMADDRDLATKGTKELPTYTGSVSTGDKTLIYDASANNGTGAWKTRDATETNEATLVSLVGDTSLSASLHANRTLNMNSSGALQTFTLPAATGTGNFYKFVVGAVNTSKYVVAVTGNDTIDGGYLANTDNASDGVVGFTPGASDSVITLNGTTTGGASIGDYFIVQDIAADQWGLSGMVTASGSEVKFSSTGAQ